MAETQPSGGEERERQTESPVEIVEFNEAGLVFRVVDSERLYGVAVDHEHPDGETINVTELDPMDFVVRPRKNGE